MLSEYATELGQDESLYQALSELQASNPTEEKIIKDELLGFKLSGIALNKADKARFKDIQAELSKLSNQFETNLLDATNAWTLTIHSLEQLKGLPQHAIETASALSDNDNEWVLTLEAPCVQAILTFAEDEHLREEVYQAFVTRASNQGPFANKWDNNPIIADILKLRHEKARLLGFNNYAELSLAKKMVTDCNQVNDFLNDLSEKVLSQARKDFASLEAFAGKKLNAWDVGFYSEKQRQALYDVSQEDLRPYFPESKVLIGLFQLCERLYGIQFKEVTEFDKYHPDLKLFSVLSEKNEKIGSLYLDLYARKDKRGGAWMDSYCGYRRSREGQIQKPVAFVTCNFAPAHKSEAYLSHDEVLTLFHEVGHALHHLLTKVPYLACSGINSVEWDAVELPSQFLENFAFEEEVLEKLSCHKDTGEQLPSALYKKLIKAKNFQSAMQMLRQVEFSLFDFLLHQHYQPEAPKSALDVLKEVRETSSVVPYPAYNQFPCGFSHIFAGGYAAGYFSYKWAEVLSSDAYARFEEEGLFDSHCGQDFLHEILQVGGSRDAMESFKAFRGREPQIDALLRHNGIKA
jgi:oligopeptidase A